MAPDSPSNLRVFVHWHNQTIFAGEELRCTITFKNVATTQPQQTHLSRIPNSDRPRPGRSNLNPHAALAPASRGHRPTSSLSVPSPTTRSRTGPTSWSPSFPSARELRSIHGHRKSISIVSIGSTATVDSQADSVAGSSRSGLHSRSHTRTSSLHISTRSNATNSLPAPRSATLPFRSVESTYSGHSRPSGASTLPNSPALQGNSVSPGRSPVALPEFRFPPIQPPSKRHADTASDNLINLTADAPDLHPRSPQAAGEASPESNSTEDIPNLPTRILAATSMGTGTPRSSGEFYALSNHSTETLQSEYISQQLPRAGRPMAHSRRQSNSPGNHARSPESLMMAYAQIQGSFTLDGSLVDLRPFDQVKRKAVLGGQGGGVIGLEANNRNSGLLGSLGWSSISTSIGDLLGGGELSSIREMRGIVNSKSIPLISTPQSILLVDLQLAPGESKSWEYSFGLPAGLPPTHKGRAIKIAYSLVIGTQRAGGSKEQQVRTVEIPFRVLGSVNSHGELLGYDLMNPYILLQDFAKVKANQPLPKARKGLEKTGLVPSAAAKSTMHGFLSYLDELQHRRTGAGGSLGLLSPTAVPSSRRPSMFEDSMTAGEAINWAIQRSNHAVDGQSPNRFEIARNGQRVGVVMLTRPAYRLGEVVNLVIDFNDGEVPCYAVNSSLETAERVDPGLAVRSEAGIHRVTRRAIATASEATLFSRRAVFSPTIPITATPEFVTSGVNLDWLIRLEFVVPAQENIGLFENMDGIASRPHPLLEQISNDERGGQVLVALENLICESFEVVVPLHVYGAVGSGLERLERDVAMEEGLVV